MNFGFLSGTAAGSIRGIRGGIGTFGDFASGGGGDQLGKIEGLDRGEAHVKGFRLVVNEKCASCAGENIT